MNQDRRSFLGALGAMAAAVPATPWGPSALRVEASTSVFFRRRPDGSETLVRFVVHEADQPAGRMRVYDRRRALLGTAGVIGGNGQLYGELWLPLTDEAVVTSELEVPGRRTPLRTEHRLRPQPEWTLHWITAVDPIRLDAMLGALPVWRRAAGTAALIASHVTGNPISAGAAESIPLLDHLPYLRMALEAGRLERRFGIPVSPVAIASAAVLRMRSASLLLNGMNASFAVLRDDDPGARPFHVLQNQGDARVVAASLTLGADPTALGFTAGRDAMARAVESWLTTAPPLLSPGYDSTMALVVSTDVEPDRPTMVAAVDEWNRRFAFPRIVMGEPEGFFRDAERIAGSVEPVDDGVGARVDALSVGRSASEPTARQVQVAAEARRADTRERVRQIITPVTAVMGQRGGLDVFGRHIAFGFPGHLVFNPSPVGKSDRVTFPDGTEHWVTNVPPVGYVYVPRGTDPIEWRNAGSTDRITGKRFRLRVDRATGAIASLIDRTQGREWAGPGGINAVPDARLQSITRLQSAAGQRLLVERATPQGDLTTAITVDDSNNWLAIDNVLEPTNSEAVVRYESTLSFDPADIAWETPGGFERGPAGAGVIAHLRWMAVDDAEGWSFLWRGIDAPWTRLDGSKLVSYAPSGQSRYRLDMAQPAGLLDEPWHFGWSGEAFEAVSVPGDGATRAPGYGRLLDVDGGAKLLGMKQSDEGFATIVYLQNVFDVAIRARLAPGVLRFGRADLVDLVERDTGTRLPIDEGGVSVPISAHGVSVVRLSDLRIADNP